MYIDMNINSSQFENHTNIATRIESDETRQARMLCSSKQPPGSTYSSPLHQQQRASSVVKHLSHQGQETWCIWDQIVSWVLAGVVSLVQELQVASINLKCLIVVGTDQVTVRDVVRPGSTAVRLAGEWRALTASLKSPGTTKRGSRERAEVAAVVSLSLEDHKILVLPLDGVDLHGLEDELVGIAEHDGGCGAEGAWEVADRHAGAVDLAVVAGEKEVHVCLVTDDGLVDRSVRCAGNSAREEGLCRTPAVSIGGVGRGPVGKLCWAPLVAEDPNGLWCEVEDRGRNGGVGHAVLRGAGHTRPVGERREDH